MVHNQKQSITHRTGTTSENNEEITERATTAAMNVQRGVNRKQVQTDRGKVLKSQMLGVQTAQLEAVRNCDQSVQRPGVRTRVMCRRQAKTEEKSLQNQDTAGDNGPREIW